VPIREASVRASTYGKEPSRFAAKIAEYGGGERLRRGFRRFLPVFGTGCALLIIPPHVLWLAGFTITALILAVQRYRQKVEILALEGRCPGCGAEQPVELPPALPAIQRCSGCGAFLKLEEV